MIDDVLIEHDGLPCVLPLDNKYWKDTHSGVILENVTFFDLIDKPESKVQVPNKVPGLGVSKYLACQYRLQV